jgi:polysaccharide deacetylase 2 family uncharacterized protein YibQ
VSWAVGVILTLGATAGAFVGVQAANRSGAVPAPAATHAKIELHANAPVSVEGSVRALRNEALAKSDGLRSGLPVDLAPRDVSPGDVLLLNVPLQDGVHESQDLAEAPLKTFARVDPISQSEISGLKPSTSLFEAPAIQAKKKVQIAIILDDMGLNSSAARRIANLPVKLTISFLPYAKDLENQTQYALDRGHQIFAHVPMQPSGDEDPGPGALMVYHSRSEISDGLGQQLLQFKGLSGINNHMGSKFTSNQMSMTWFMAEVKKRDLLFVDSLTSPDSYGAKVAQAYGLPYLKRDFFIDHNAKGNATLIEKRLNQLAAKALADGQVIAIGHPYIETIAGLEAWIPAMQAKGVEFVTIADVVESRETDDSLLAAAP